MDTADLQVAIADTMAVPASTYALVSNGAQNAIIGNEIVGIVDAQDLGSGAYRIGPNIIRGMRGSPSAGHQAGEPFAAAPSIASTTKVRVDPQYIGRIAYVRMFSPGQDPEEAIEIPVLIAAPKSPYVTSLPQWDNEPLTGDMDGVNAMFSLSHAPVTESETITLNGAVLDRSLYSISGSNLTLSSPPPAGSTGSAKYQYLP